MIMLIIARMTMVKDSVNILIIEDDEDIGVDDYNTKPFE